MSCSMASLTLTLMSSTVPRRAPGATAATRTTAARASSAVLKRREETATQIEQMQSSTCSTSQRRRRRGSRRVLVSAALRTEAAGCPVFLPPPRSRPPKGIIHFVGGAFAGASPALSYGLLLSLLAEGGYTVVATPFAVSFKHAEAASKVSRLFNDAVEQLSRNPETSWAVVSSGGDSILPVHGVGHSMGSLLHLLSCSLNLGGGGGGGSGSGGSSSSSCSSNRSSNVLLSFNNRPVGDAVPVSRGALAGAARAARDFSSAAAAALGNVAAASSSSSDSSSSAPSPASPTPPTQLSSKALFDGALGALSAAGIRVPEAARAALADAAPAIDQLGSVAAEMATRNDASPPPPPSSSSSSSPQDDDGESVEFVPSPAESRGIIESNYAVPRTFLVKFENDTIDETPSMAALLRKVNAAGVAVSTLPGSHVTPCGGELPSTTTSSNGASPNAAPSAVDLLAMGGAALLQADTRRLAAAVLDWLDRVPRAGSMALPAPEGN